MLIPFNYRRNDRNTRDVAYNKSWSGINYYRNIITVQPLRIQTLERV